MKNVQFVEELNEYNFRGILMSRLSRINEKGEITRSKATGDHSRETSTYRPTTITTQSTSGSTSKFVIGFFGFIIFVIVLIIINRQPQVVNNEQFIPPNNSQPSSTSPETPTISANQHLDYSDGSTYDGQVINSKREGNGILNFPENNEMNYWKYDGEFKEDLKNGKGILYLKDGSRYEGTWISDMREGEFIYYDANGNQEIQSFSEGVRIK